MIILGKLVHIKNQGRMFRNIDKQDQLITR